MPTTQRQEWTAIRAELAGRRYAAQMHALLNRCEASRTLRRIMPYTSLGRIGLGLPGSTHLYPLFKDDSPCLYFDDGCFVVSTYDNLVQRRFATAAEAVAFAEQHPTATPAY